MSPVGVLHLIDTLEVGGAERVAVNLVNHLPRRSYELHLCTSRHEGPLARDIAHHVRRLSLSRRGTLDLLAIQRLVGYVRSHSVQLVHAHSTSLFVAVVASLFPPFPKVIWHDHFGRYAIETRSRWLYRLVARRVSGVIAVNEPLAAWSRHCLHMSDDRVWYIPNFASQPEGQSLDSPTELPGNRGSRVVCVANLRSQKDHITLLQAMYLVAHQVPEAHLLLLGAPADPVYLKEFQSKIVEQGLQQNVTWLGQRSDVYRVLRACDIAVLSSASEGLPLALIEYGMIGLPAVATRVGQCAEVLDNGRAGILVPPKSPEELANALLWLLRFPEEGKKLGERFRHRVQGNYSADSLVERVCGVYDSVLRLG